MDFNSHTKNALDFLMYSYFGVTFDNETKDILKAAVSKAYNDATMRAALSLNDKAASGDKYENIKDKKEFKAVRFLLKEWAIKTVTEKLQNAKIKDIDTWHKDLCDSLAGDKGFDSIYRSLLNSNEDIGYIVHDQSKFFTYGNAQKLVNMTLKNLYVITSISALYCDQIEGAEKWHEEYKWTVGQSDKFHIPLDSYIYKLADISDKEERWSKISDYDKYIKTKDDVKKEITSLSDECPKWIKKAKDGKTDEYKKAVEGAKDLNLGSLSEVRELLSSL